MASFVFFLVLYLLYRGLTAQPNVLGQENPLKTAAYWIIIVFIFSICVH